MKRRKIEVSDHANDIVKALSKGVLLTTKADKVDSMVIGWGTLGINWRKPVFAAYVREGRYTRAQLDKNPEFTVNVPVGEYDGRIIEVCGSKSGRNTDKVKEAGLTTVEAESISVPAIKEFPLTLECRVMYIQKQDLSMLSEDINRRLYPKDVVEPTERANRDAHITYYGEIINAYIIED